MGPLPKPVVTYAILGAVAFFVLSGKRKKKVGKVVTGAVLGGALAYAAPRLGLRLPGTQPALPAA